MITQIFNETLKKNGYYSTKERLEVFQLLLNNKSLLSLHDIVEKTNQKLDRSTVYRTIDTFEKLGITKRVFTAGSYKIELSDKFSSHHHHMVCENCGNVISFRESQSLKRELERLEEAYEFKSKSHTLELSGLCKNCKNNLSN